MTKVEIAVGGMTCDGCERSITTALQRIDGVRAVNADHRTGFVRIESDVPVDRARLDAAIDDAGYVVIPPGSTSLPMA